LAPSAGLMPLSSIINLLEHFDQVTDLVNHSAHFRRIDQFAGAANFAKTQTTNRCTMRLFAADRTAHELNRHFLLSSHFEAPAIQTI